MREWWKKFARQQQRNTCVHNKKRLTENGQKKGEVETEAKLQVWRTEASMEVLFEKDTTNRSYCFSTTCSFFLFVLQN